jgi:D-alanyl-D-alanine carboxypeptidase/D-alanyl-D-alanine-endopeptidase (penicillin-binding protein 4)
MLKISPLLILVFVTMTVGFCAPPADLVKTLDRMVATLLTNPACADAAVGIVVRSLDDGSSWYSRDADKAFIPASTAKIVTAAQAIAYLGPQYRFTTRLLATGTVVNGTLKGDLILQGGGDPTLSPQDIRMLAHALATCDLAIKAIDGRIRTDESFFPTIGPQLGPWEKSDLPWYYAAPTSALSCNRNAITITVRGSTSAATAASGCRSSRSPASRRSGSMIRICAWSI